MSFDVITGDPVPKGCEIPCEWYSDIAGTAPQQYNHETRFFAHINAVQESTLKQEVFDTIPTLSINLEGVGVDTKRKVYRAALTTLQYEAVAMRHMALNAKNIRIDLQRRMKMIEVNLRSSLLKASSKSLVIKALYIRMCELVDRLTEEGVDGRTYSLNVYEAQKKMLAQLEEFDESTLPENELPDFQEYSKLLKESVNNTYGEFSVIESATFAITEEVFGRFGEKYLYESFIGYDKANEITDPTHSNIVPLMKVSRLLWANYYQEFCVEEKARFGDAAIYFAEKDEERRPAPIELKVWAMAQLYKKFEIKKQIQEIILKTCALWDRGIAARKEYFEGLEGELKRTFGKQRIEYLKFAKIQFKESLLDEVEDRRAITSLTSAVFESSIEWADKKLAHYREKSERKGGMKPDEWIDRARLEPKKGAAEKSKKGKGKKKGKQRIQRPKKNAETEVSTAPVVKKVRKPRVWNIDFGEAPKELPGKTLKGFTHPRVARWREVDSHTQVGSNHDIFPEYRGSDNTRYQHAIHAFAKEIDRFAEYGYQAQMNNNTYFLLPAEMELDGEKHEGVVAWARNQNGVVYHRCFEKKSLSDVITKLEGKSFGREDFAHVDEGEKFTMPKGKEKETHESSTGVTIQIEPVLGTITVKDTKLDATFRLIPLTKVANNE